MNESRPSIHEETAVYSNSEDDDDESDSSSDPELEEFSDGTGELIFRSLSDSRVWPCVKSCENFRGELGPLRTRFVTFVGDEGEGLTWNDGSPILCVFGAFGDSFVPRSI